MTLDEFKHWYKKSRYRVSSGYNTAAMLVSDSIGTLCSFGGGFFIIRLCSDELNFKSFVIYWPFILVFLLFFAFFSLYPGISLAPSDELRHLSVSSLMGHVVIVLSRYIDSQSLDLVSIAFAVSFVFCPTILLLARSLTRELLSKTRFGGIPAIIYGAGVMGRTIVDKLLDKRKLGYTPALILDDDPNTGEEYRGIPIIHDSKLGPEIVQRFRIKMAIVAMSHISRKNLVRLINDSVSAFRYNIMIPDFFGITSIWTSARDFDGLFGLATSQKLKVPGNTFLKRLTDLSAVIVGGLIISPFLLLVALLVKISSPGPVLYGHTRIGQSGKFFKTYKFRTMVIDADKRLNALLDSDENIRQEWERSMKLKNDPRITMLGKFLRKTSIDEFPQLINVLRGEMSLVGPRPIVQAEIAKYGDDFKRIFSVKPGITGLWQVSGRSDTDYADRVSFDTYYLQNWSLWLDLWVLHRTLGVVLHGRGAY